MVKREAPFYSWALHCRPAQNSSDEETTPRTCKASPATLRRVTFRADIYRNSEEPQKGPRGGLQVLPTSLPPQRPALRLRHPPGSARGRTAARGCSRPASGSHLPEGALPRGGPARAPYHAARPAARQRKTRARGGRRGLRTGRGRVGGRLEGRTAHRRRERRRRRQRREGKP